MHFKKINFILVLITFCFSTVILADDLYVCVKKMPINFVVKQPVLLTLGKKIYTTKLVDCISYNQPGAVVCVPKTSQSKTCFIKFSNIDGKENLRNSIYYLSISPDRTSRIDQSQFNSFSFTFKKNDITSTNLKGKQIPIVNLNYPKQND